MKQIYLNIKLFFKNWHFVFVQDKNIAHSFAGYGRHYLAKRYADKRTAATSKDGVTGRKRHFCFPYSTDIIMVCNRSEINGLVDKKIISRKVNIHYLMEHASYISKIILLALLLAGCRKPVTKCVTYYDPMLYKPTVFYTQQPYNYHGKVTTLIIDGNNVTGFTVCEGLTITK